VEQTHNRAGGRVLSMQYLASLKAWAEANQLAVHMDGARMFNAAAALGDLRNGLNVCAICVCVVRSALWCTCPGKEAARQSACSRHQAAMQAAPFTPSAASLRALSVDSCSDTCCLPRRRQREGDCGSDRHPHVLLVKGSLAVETT